MKKILSIVIFFLFLLPMTPRFVHTSSSSAVAQKYGNENKCYDDYFKEWYFSSLPCGVEPCVSPCPYCDDSFGCDELDSHKAVCGNGDEDYTCSWCDKHFTSYDEYAQHQMTCGVDDSSGNNGVGGSNGSGGSSGGGGYNGYSGSGNTGNIVGPYINANETIITRIIDSSNGCVRIPQSAIGPYTPARNGFSPSDGVLMSKHVYGGEDADDVNKVMEELGWSISSDTFGLKMVEGLFYQYDQYGRPISYGGSGFKSQLYTRTKNGKIEFCMAFAGTDDLEDGIEDIKQFFGSHASQYEQAIENAKQLVASLKRQYGDSVKITFTGHSLGGGLAAAASMATGECAVTFNPAAVRCADYMGDDSNIYNYIALGNKIASAGGYDIGCKV